MARSNGYEARAPSLTYGAIVPGKVHGSRVHGERLEAIRGNERMGIRHAQARRGFRHIQAICRRGPGRPQDCCHACHTVVKSRDFALLDKILKGTSPAETGALGLRPYPVPAPTPDLGVA